MTLFAFWIHGRGRQRRERGVPSGLIKRALALAGLVLSMATGRAAADGITGAQADSILAELKQIRVLLETQLRQSPVRQGAPAAAADRNVTLPPGTDFRLGRDDARLTLVEFTDYQCPYCRQYHISTFEQLKKDYIDTGRIRYVSRDLPLDFHKLAFGAANAARCAGEQGKFWELRHVMIVNADRLTTDALITYAKDLGLDASRFQACLKSEKYAPEIRKDLSVAQAAGITGTPSFVLGKTTKVGAEGVVLVGNIPYADLEARIRDLLSK